MSFRTLIRSLLGAILISLGCAGLMAAPPTKASFDQLGGFPFSPPTYDADNPDAPVAPMVEEQIPPAIRKLDGQHVTITGFMLPTRMEKNIVKEFLLMRDQQMCCFGVQPQMNEWIVVKPTKPVAYTPDIPKTFAGVLRVGPLLENDYLSGIYLLEDAKPL